MSFSEQEINEFKAEALELLDAAEKSLLSLDEGGDFRCSFDQVFRSFHNLKGASGMMELLQLQAHTHELESILMTFKDATALPPAHISFFLRGIDGARALLAGEELQFSYEVTTSPQASPDPVLATPAASETVFEATPRPMESGAPLDSKNSAMTPPASALGEYFSEMNDVLERISGQLRTIEAGSSTAETINDAYRDIHSLKGTSYLFGFNRVGDLAHAMESSMEPLREGTHKHSPLLMNALFHAVEWMEMQMNCLKTDPQDQMLNDLIPGLVKSLMNATELLPSAFIAPAPTVKSAAAPTPNPTPPAVASSTATAAPSPTPKVVSVAAAKVDPTKEAEAGSIRVPVSLLDSLMTLMGEMVLVRNQVLQFAGRSENQELQNLSKRLNVVTSEIQGEMMKTRMQPIGHILTKFHRVVRDLSQELGKNITLSLQGAETELDKSLLEAIKDPLTHIVRNSCDHGIETIQARKDSGKSTEGTIHVKAYHEGGQVVVEISDDGKGLHPDVLLKKSLEKGLITQTQASTMTEKEIFNLIFAPGFSTAASVTNISGRGVGMDVVRTNIEKIGGSVELTSVPGQGTTTKLKIPLTLAIVPALMIRSRGNSFAIPQVKLEELLRIETKDAAAKIELLHGVPVYRLRGQILPLVQLSHVLTSTTDPLKLMTDPDQEACTVAVLNSDHGTFGLVVDEVHDTGDIVVKPINRLLKGLQVYSGATILGDGSISLILDVNGIAKRSNLSQDKLRQDVREDKRRLAEQNRAVQDFLLFRTNSPTTHSMVMGFVHRLEEFEPSKIEMSGSLRVVRYGQNILPLLSAGEQLGYGPTPEDFQRPRIPVVVIQKAGLLYGLVVSEIVDTLSTTLEVESPMVKQHGIYGNLNSAEQLIVTIDPYELIEKAYPASVAKPVGIDSGFSAASIANFQKIRILVAEDTSFFRKAFLKVLEDAGHEVTLAFDGQDALDFLQKDPKAYDMVISDIEMPRLNGFDLAKAIRADQKIADIPLMAVSSRADAKSAERGMKSGFNVYLEKLKPDLLLNGVQMLAAQRGAA